MCWAVEEHQVKSFRFSQSAFDGREFFNWNLWLKLGPVAPSLPFRRGSLGGIEIGNLHCPSGANEFDGEQPRKSGFADAAFLGNQ
jgi:hypothetical protein